MLRYVAVLFERLGCISKLTDQIGALVTHVILFWRKDVWASIKALRSGTSEDRHHSAMIARYKEVPYWWYLSILLFAFVLGIIVTTTQNITMPVWSYIIALSVGAFIAPFVSSLIAPVLRDPS